MMSGNIGAAGVQAAGALLSSIFNARSQKKTNKQMMQFQEKMFDRANEYNTPLNQMKRFQEAGLNPNLIYGQGNPGNSSMPGAPSLKAPELGDLGDVIANPLSKYYERATANQNLDNLKAQEEYTKNKAFTESFKALSEEARNTGMRIKNEYMPSRERADLENVLKRTDKVLTDTAFTNAQNIRADMIADQTVRKLSTEINLNKLRGKGVNLDNLIKEMDESLYREHGIRPTDPGYLRAAGSILQRFDSEYNDGDIFNLESRLDNSIDYPRYLGPTGKYLYGKGRNFFKRK